MCGVVAAITNGSISCIDILFQGLEQLQNRGYDSAGICSINGKKVLLVNKYASTEKTTALEKLNGHITEHISSHIGIAHTRWATHGPKTDSNSHPHTSMDKKFSLVHNGIIENFKELKEKLLDLGYIFISQTDTEVIVQLLSHLYSVYNNDIVKTINETISLLKGTWGLVIICIDTPDTLYCTRHGSPLLISHTDDFAIIVSEQAGFARFTNNYFILNNHDICIIQKANNKIMVTTAQEYAIKTMTESLYNDIVPDPYPNWTIKEIFEQSDSINRAISFGGRLQEEVKLGGLESYKEQLCKIDNLILLGCGTSYHAGMLGVFYFKELCNFNSVQLFDGSEFTEMDIPRYGNTVLLLLSQSGETKDLHRCIKIAKDNNLFTIGLVNVVDSLIAREVDCGCYLNAGREVAVASTKSFTSHCILLSMVAIWFAQSKNINHQKCAQYIRDLHSLQMDVSNVLANVCEKVSGLTSLFVKNSCFILGKGKSHAIAKEGSLKIKEISYIHSEGYSTSSLKHGPFALLCNDFPVILIAPDDEHYVSNENAYNEIYSRHAKIIFITDKREIMQDKENVVVVPRNKTYAQILVSIPLQMIADNLALSKGYNPDFPKNLAKVVTVE